MNLRCFENNSLLGLILTCVIVLLLLSCRGADPEDTGEGESDRLAYALVIHGGSGNISRDMDPERKKLREEGLTGALLAGREILENGGSSLDAVEAAVVFLENHPSFNAGKGAVLTNEARHELDAGIMDGAKKKAGSVTGVTTVKNPIKLARKIMEEDKHIFYWGSGAERKAEGYGLEMVDNGYFLSPEKSQILKDNFSSSNETLLEFEQQFSLGTVGAVALDKEGNIAAATSTGGRSNKEHGRIGDSPVVGAGVYADNQTCGVSATGAGEYFILNNIGFHLSALMQYKGLNIKDAGKYLVFDVLEPNSGGIIGIDRNGNIIDIFNTTGMYRGKLDASGLFEISIW